MVLEVEIGMQIEACGPGKERLQPMHIHMFRILCTCQAMTSRSMTVVCMLLSCVNLALGDNISKEFLLVQQVNTPKPRYELALVVSSIPLP